MPNIPVLLSTAYFAPVQYYSKFLAHPEIYIEQLENFHKQTYRNRCVVMGANGPVSLVVPVVKGRGRKILIKDLKISYDTLWQRIHWRTIFSAYSSSPFFEFYQFEIEPFYQKKWKYLLEMNLAINETICDLLGLDNTISLTKDFEAVPESALNFREMISPKNKTQMDAGFRPKKYTQVFSEKYGFAPNQSILDLLFNEGPNAYSVLEASSRQVQH